jgi:hypothetical protein
VTSGSAVLRLDKVPANNVVIAVVANTDYKYLGDATRKAKFDYRLVPETGVTGAAEINKKWYDVKLDYTPGTTGVQAVVKPKVGMGIALANDRNAIEVSYALERGSKVKISLYTAYGALIGHVIRGAREAGSHKDLIQLEKFGIRNGTFLVTMQTESATETRSITVVR